MARVLLKAITKRYEGNAEDTVKRTDLEIHDKEFMIFVGPSGCGKSTTLRMIAGLEDITSGEIAIGDTVVNDLPPKDRDIAMVFQNYALYPHMNVYDNMAFGLTLRGTPKDAIRRKVLEASEILGLTDLLERKPAQLSGGQRQRVALGRAIVREPRVFLMDEPLSNLDAKLRVQMRAEINKLHKRLKTTVIYVTHDQTEAMTMGDRICVLNGGYVQQCDTPQVLYDSPANKFVAGFIGSPAMNFLDCRLNRGVLEGKNFSISLPKKMLKGLTSFDGCEIVLGVRPEDIDSAEKKSSKQTQEATLKCTCTVVEPMGAENFLYLQVDDDHTMIARVAPDIHPKYGDDFEAWIDLNKIHLFNKKTEETIL